MGGWVSGTVDPLEEVPRRHGREVQTHVPQLSVEEGHAPASEAAPGLPAVSHCEPVALSHVPGCNSLPRGKFWRLGAERMNRVNV